MSTILCKNLRLHVTFAFPTAMKAKIQSQNAVSTPPPFRFCNVYLQAVQINRRLRAISENSINSGQWVPPQFICALFLHAMHKKPNRTSFRFLLNDKLRKVHICPFLNTNQSPTWMVTIEQCTCFPSVIFNQKTPEMEVTEIILAQVSRLFQLSSHSRGLSRLQIFKSIGLANGLKWVKISLFHVLDVFSAKTSLSAY